METVSSGSGTPTFKDSAPMEFDRTIGWKYYTDRGDVFQADGQWVLTSREAVEFAHQNPEIFSSAKAFEGLGSPVPLIPLAVDRPDHIKYRRVLDPLFAPRVINGMEDDLRAQVNGLIDQFIETGSCDLVADLAIPYPSQVIMTLFGLPLEDLDSFLEWNQLILEAADTKLDEPTPQQAEGAMQLFGYLQGFIERKRAEPGEDLISSVLAFEGDDAWSDNELLGMCFLFVLAGLDTVTASIGFLMLYLARDPELRRQLSEDSSLISPFVEEVLRLELPAPSTPRVTTQDVEVCGHLIPEGSTCLLVLATVNRDEQHGPDADELMIRPGRLGHLTFGGGIHRCLGSHLARREMTLVVEEFLRRVPEFSIDGDYEPKLVWPSGTLHLASLPLVFEPGLVA